MNRPQETLPHGEDEDFINDGLADRYMKFSFGSAFIVVILSLASFSNNYRVNIAGVDTADGDNTTRVEGLIRKSEPLLNSTGTSSNGLPQLESKFKCVNFQPCALYNRDMHANLVGEGYELLPDGVYMTLEDTFDEKKDSDRWYVVEIPGDFKNIEDIEVFISSYTLRLNPGSPLKTILHVRKEDGVYKVIVTVNVGEYYLHGVRGALVRRDKPQYRHKIDTF